MGTDPFQVLGVSPDASEDEIRQAVEVLAVCTKIVSADKLLGRE